MPKVELKHGMFSWTDLASPEPDAAKSFYQQVFGWEYTDVPAGDFGTYTLCRKGGEDVAGLSGQPPAMAGLPAIWTSYVRVDDVDATTAKVSDLGGEVVMPATDVLTSGRMSMATDPGGAAFALWEARDHGGAGLFNEHGTLVWNELNTRSLDAVRPFYGDLLGWDISQQDVGGMQYDMITLGDRPNGGMMDMSENFPPEVPSHWMVYFQVDDVDAAAERASSAGGTVAVPPMDIPVGRMSVVQDPHGGTFTVFKPSAG